MRVSRWNRRLLPAGMVLGLALVQAISTVAQEQEPGWVDLFGKVGADGQLAGWTRLTIPPGGTVRPSSQWVFDRKTGILTCQGDGGHEWLRYDQPQGDCIYRVEWRFVPVTSGKTGYNSGIYVRNSDDAKVWHQAQTGGGSGGFLFGETLVDGKPKRINLQPQLKAKTVKPPGEWNTFELTAKGKTIMLVVNGQETNRWDDCQVSSGFVGLEAEGYRIEFRNVRLKPL